MALDNLLVGTQLEVDILQVDNLVEDIHVEDTLVEDIHVEDILAEGILVEGILVGGSMHQVVAGIHVEDILHQIHVQDLREILCRLCLIHHTCPSHLPFFFTLENRQAPLISVQIKLMINTQLRMIEGNEIYRVSMQLFIQTYIHHTVKV